MSGRAAVATMPLKHADDRPVRARERTVLRVRYRAADCVGSGIPDRAISKSIADQINAIPVLVRTDLVSFAAGGLPEAFPPFPIGYHIAP